MNAYIGTHRGRPIGSVRANRWKERSLPNFLFDKCSARSQQRQNPLDAERRVAASMPAKKKNFKEYLVAGGTAGMIARTCVAPIERIKILYQIQRASTAAESQSYMALLPQILQSEGPLSLWRGNSAAVVRVVPYMSIQFASFEGYRDWVADQIGGDSAAATAVGAGSMAGVTAVAATYPLDTVRARMALQIEGAAATQYSGVADALRTIAREEGAGALYRGISATMCGVAPYTGLKFGTYELMKGFLREATGLEEQDLPAYMRVASGSTAGLFALTFVYPFDVVRRRMQTHRGGSRYASVPEALTTILREEGVSRGLYRGLSLNYIKTLPNVAIYMSLYDVIKYRVFRRDS